MTAVKSTIACCAALLLGFAPAALADAPELKYLIPSGAQRGQTVEITVGGKLGTAPVRAWCSRNDVTIDVPEKGKTFSVQVPADARPGVCWIRLMNAEGASALRPFVIGTLPELADAEPNNDLDKPQPLPSSQVLINGALDKRGDVDAFAVPLEAGQTLVAAIDAHELLGSPMDAVLQIVFPSGFVAEQNDDARGFDPLIAFEARETGTHYVRLFAFPSQPNSSVRLSGGADYVYRLTLTTGPYVDHTLPLSVMRGEDRTIELQGWNIGEALRQFPITGDAKTAAVAHPELANTWNVRLDELPAQVEQQPGTSKQPTEIIVPGTVSGRIGRAGEEDVFAFAAKKGDKLSFRVDSRSLGQKLDAVIELKTADGKSLKRVDDPRRNEFDAVLDFTMPADGRYLISITDLFGHGGLRYAYRLTIDESRPDFELSTAADTFKLTAGTPLKIPVTVTRQKGFAGEIEVTALGLPEGVSVTPAVSVNKKETAKKVELELTAAADVVVDGGFQIVGTPQGEAKEQSRTATAPIAGLTVTTSDFWLNVVKPAKAEAKEDKK